MGEPVSAVKYRVARPDGTGWDEYPRYTEARAAKRRTKGAGPVLEVASLWRCQACDCAPADRPATEGAALECGRLKRLAEGSGEPPEAWAEDVVLGEV